jgi:thermitase
MAMALAVVAGLLVGAAAPGGAAANGEPFGSAQWGVRQIEADVAWDLTRGRGARVGIIDTGIDFTHSELAGRVLASTRCMGTGGMAARCGGSAQDDSGHGTHVAGIIGAPLDGVGVAGVAPEASLLVVKALESDGSGQAPDVAAGIDWLLAQGANVVNLSLAETLSPRRVQGSPLEAAIHRAYNAGAVVVLAAGNHGEAADGTTAFNLPAIVVGATAPSGRLARYSRPLNSGIRWGIVAPGGDGSGGAEAEVVSTYWFAGRRNAYAWSEGTSMAAPHVAGAAGLLAAQNVRGQAAVDRLLGTAAPAACGTGCRGLLNARAAVGAPPRSAQAVSNGPPTPAPTTPATPEPPPATATVPPTLPPVVEQAPPLVEVIDEEEEEAPEPIDLQVAIAVPRGRETGHLAARLAVVAGASLLAVAAVTVLVAAGPWRARRRLRADEEW